jgi:osmotically-inducible protein OsmY
MEHIADRPDAALRTAVEDALAAAIGSQAPHVGVATDHGSVTLTGELVADADRDAAHAATIAVWGVHSVANDLVLRDTPSRGTTDTDIAVAAQKALQHGEGVPTDTVIAEVTNQVITLTGTVASIGERVAAERAVMYVPGLTRINNRVTVDDGT